MVREKDLYAEYEETVKREDRNDLLFFLFVMGVLVAGFGLWIILLILTK